MKKLQRNSSLPQVTLNIDLNRINKKKEKHPKTINILNFSKSKVKLNNKKEKNNLIICIRCRPLLSLEKQISSDESIIINDNKIIILTSPSNSNKQLNYSFDYVFDQNAEQKEIFNNINKNIIDSLFEGFNINIFTLGASKSGKTYTLFGNDSNPGLIYLSLEKIFSKINSIKNKKFNIKFSCFEKYKDNIKDLLNNRNLELKENQEKKIIIDGISQIKVKNINDIENLLKKGIKNRTQEIIINNEIRYLSHVILQITLENKDKNNSDNSKNNILTFVDFSGKAPLIEGNDINLNDTKNQNEVNEDSKIIKFFNYYLTEKSKNIMIANISPSVGSFDETYNTLKSSDELKNIQNLDINYIIKAQYHLNNFEETINNLKNQVNELKVELKNKERKNILNQKFSNINLNINENNKTYRNRNNLSNINFKTFFYSENHQQEKNIKMPDFPPNINQEKNVSINQLTEEEFQSKISDLRQACDNQVLIKQKIISIKREINRTKLQINNENTLANLQKDILINTFKYKEYSSQIEKINNEIKAKNNISELQKYVLSLIMKNSSHKIQMLDNKYYNLLNKSKIILQQDYIEELEKQIILRDKIIAENDINKINNITKFKELNNLREEFYNQNNYNIDIDTSPIFQPFLQENISVDRKNNLQISLNKLKEFKLKNISINNSMCNNKNIQKENNIFNLFNQQTNLNQKKLISYKKGYSLNRIRNISEIENMKDNIINCDSVFNTKNYESDFLGNNKNEQIQKNDLKKLINKRNINRKIFLEKLNFSNKSIY